MHRRIEVLQTPALTNFATGPVAVLYHVSVNFHSLFLMVSRSRPTSCARRAKASAADCCSLSISAGRASGCLLTGQFINPLSIQFADIMHEVYRRHVTQRGLFFKEVMKIGALALEESHCLLRVRFGENGDEDRDLLEIRRNISAGDRNEGLRRYLACDKNSRMMRDLFCYFVLSA